MWCWINGKASPVSEGAVSVIDHGFTVGDGVFETLKTVDGTPFALSRHLHRLSRSAVGLGLPVPDLDLIRAAAAEVLAAQSYPFGALRITYTSGPGPLGSSRGDEGATVAVVSMPATPLATHDPDRVESLAPERTLTAGRFEDDLLRGECGLSGGCADRRGQ